MLIIFQKAIILIICSLSIYFSLKISKQNWVNTYHHFITYLLLPQIGMIITYIITDDLALSLGMVGALSIVRFRTPVKNPLELVIFFGLLTIGIALAKQINLGIILAIIICGIILSVKFLSNLFNNKIDLFSLSFDEGIAQNTLDIQSKISLEILENNKLLKNYYFDNQEKTHTYRISSIDEKEITYLKDKLKNDQSIISLDLNFS